MCGHILVVDDSDTIRLAVSSALCGAGYKVTEASNGLEALEKLAIIADAGLSLSLILTDINMPAMDGITLIREIRKGSFKFVPILVLSSEAAESSMKRAISAGASGWLQKPFLPEQVFGAIRKLVWSGDRTD